MRLKYLTLPKLIDTAYWCGMDGTPVSVLIAAPPGAGKTWATESLINTEFVHYLAKPISPNEHRKTIARNSARTRLFINDDLGLCSRWNAKEYFSTFCMIADGDMRFTQYKHTVSAQMQCSMVLCCTISYFNDNFDDMNAVGLMDRVVTIAVKLSRETRKSYQQLVLTTDLHNRHPPERDPVFTDIHPADENLLKVKNIDPRLLNNLRRMSQYLTDDEIAELVTLAHSEQLEFEI